MNSTSNPAGGNGLLFRFQHFYIKRFAEDPAEYNRARTLFWYIVFWCTAWAFYFAQNILFNGWLSIVAYACAAGLVISYFVMLPRASIGFLGQFVSYSISLFLLIVSALQGGVQSNIMIWVIAVIPTAAYTFAPSGVPLRLVVFGSVGALVLYALELFWSLPQNQVPDAMRSLNYFSSWIGAGIMSLIFSRLIELDRRRAMDIVEQAHAEILQLKEKQDADYFLTSLVLDPLSGDWNRSESVRVQSYMRQHKRFRFRKWNGEIGGDINIVDSLVIDGRPYTIFLNGDAMGKSMQGAGGAIVLGAVFRGVIARARTRPPRSPETFLSSTFQEFQNVYESFDGSMLMSAAYGLIDDGTGETLFLVLEHPWPVLYRDGQARFAVDVAPGVDIPYAMKFGTPGNAERFHLLRLRLQPGERLILGSDGRDDLDLPEGGVNEDETLFLRVVEESGGDLEAIERRLREIGGVRDDLSLMCLEYTGPGPAPGDGLRSVKAAATRLIKAGDHAEALSLMEDFTRTEPPDGAFLYYMAFAAYRLKRFEVAELLAERARIRRPDFEPVRELQEKIRRRRATSTGAR